MFWNWNVTYTKLIYIVANRGSKVVVEEFSKVINYWIHNWFCSFRIQIGVEDIEVLGHEIDNNQHPLIVKMTRNVHLEKKHKYSVVCCNPTVCVSDINE